MFGHIDLVGVSARVTKEGKTHAIVNLLLLGRAFSVLYFVLLRRRESLIIEAKRRFSIY